MSPRFLSLAILFCLFFCAADASANESARFEERAQSLATKIAKRALDRARRALVLGPQIGVAPTYTFDGDSGFRTSFGLSLLYFDIPIIPTVESLKSILLGQAVDQFRLELEAMVAEGRGSTEEEKAALAQKVWQEVLEEFNLKHKPKRFEKPKLAARTSARRLSSEGASAWEIGLTLGIGIGPLYFSGGESVQVNNGSGLNTDFELALPMTLTKGLRSPTVEFFLRVSLANTKRDERPDRAMLGARIMLDII